MASKNPKTSKQRTDERLVLGLDVGSTATRGALYDTSAHPLPGRAKREHSFRTAADGTSEIDADTVVGEIEQILSELAATKAARRVAGIALDTFASSLVGVGADGRAVTPCYTYADSRCSDDVTALRAELDETEIQQATGTRLHTSYTAPRLRWLRRTDPARAARVRTWMSLGEYVQLRLAGTTAAGTPTAAWHGLLDRRTGEWYAPLLDAAGVEPSSLNPIQDPHLPLDGASSDRWPSLAGAAWFPAIGDGLGSNLGTGARDATTMACACATSGALRVLVEGQPAAVPSGLWCYRVDAGHSLVGGALNDVGRVLTWARAVLRLPDSTPDVDAILAADPTPATPTVVPFLTGERSTGWAARARLAMSGVSAASGPSDLVRGAAEGLVASYVRLAEQLRTLAPAATRIVASGGVAQAYPSFLQMLADGLGVEVQHVEIKRATLLGTALVALQGVAPDTPRYVPAPSRTFRPRPAFHDHYQQVRERFEQLYPLAVA